MKTKTFFSEFRSDIAVAILGKDDYRYEIMKPLFEQCGYGFAETSSGCVFIDGTLKLNKHELKCVEAHEVAHIMLNHTKERNDKDEEQADTFAWLLLVNAGYDKAANLIVKYFKERHDKEFDAFLLAYNKK